MRLPGRLEELLSSTIADWWVEMRLPGRLVELLSSTIADWWVGRNATPWQARGVAE